MKDSSLPLESLKRTVEIRQRIDELQTELSVLPSGGSGSVASAPTKSKLSPEARARIAAAQKARWAWARRKAMWRSGGQLHDIRASQ